MCRRSIFKIDFVFGTLKNKWSSRDYLIILLKLLKEKFSEFKISWNDKFSTIIFYQRT